MFKKLNSNCTDQFCGWMRLVKLTWLFSIWAFGAFLCSLVSPCVCVCFPFWRLDSGPTARPLWSWCDWLFTASAATFVWRLTAAVVDGWEEEEGGKEWLHPPSDGKARMLPFIVKGINLIVGVKAPIRDAGVEPHLQPDLITLCSCWTCSDFRRSCMNEGVACFLKENGD